MLFHVQSTHAADYLTLREKVLPDARTCRQAHVALHISRGDSLVAAGPRVDGAGAQLFYDAPDEDTLARWLHEDPYALAGVWSGMSWHALPVSVRSPARVPPCLDGSRRAIVIAGQLDGVADAQGALARALARRGLAGAGMDGQGRFAGWFSAGHEDALVTAEELGLHPTHRDLADVVWAL